MQKHVHKDGCIIIGAMAVYTINRIWLKHCIDTPFWSYLLRCHLNDFIGGVVFIAYINIILALSIYHSYRINKIRIAAMIMFLCGIAWEYVLPLIYPRGTADPLDIAAYMLGGICYALLIKTNPRLFSKKRAHYD